MLAPSNFVCVDHTVRSRTGEARRGAAQRPADDGAGGTRQEGELKPRSLTHTPGDVNTHIADDAPGPAAGHAAVGVESGSGAAPAAGGMGAPRKAWISRWCARAVELIVVIAAVMAIIEFVAKGGG